MIRQDHRPAGATATTPRLCTRCVLPETFPNISFDDRGICNHCLREEKMLAGRAGKTGEYRQRLDNLIADVRGSAPLYDAVMAYSGGKDSSYTIKLLRERYDLRVLTFTFDNHFMSPTAAENIRRVTDSLGVDHVSFRLPWPTMKSVFRLTADHDIFSAASLLRASSICTACIGFVKSLTTKIAVEMEIPLAAFGWSPGQAPIQAAIMKTNAALIRQSQKSVIGSFPEELRNRITTCFIPERYYSMYGDRFPTNIHPLAFFEYDEQKITDGLKSIGWTPPMNTDTNSTNCLLNAFANQKHLERHRFHPYVWEIANMVRQGVVAREDGIGKIYTPQEFEQVEYARKKLGF